MNFYTGAPRFLPPVLTKLGYACLAFNRRGHDILAIRNSRAAEGAAFQTYAEGDRGQPHRCTMGRAERDFPSRSSSATATAACSPCATSPIIRRRRSWSCCPRIAAVENMLPLACKAGLAGAGASGRVHRKGKESEARRSLMLLPGWWYAITAESFLDLANCPDILELAPQIGCPVLYVRGGRSRAISIRPRNFAEALQAARAQIEIVPTPTIST